MEFSFFLAVYLLPFCLFPPPPTGITLQLIAFIRFLSFRCSLTRCSVRFFIYFFTLSCTFLTSISLLCSHPRNLYTSLLSGSSAFIFSSITGNPSPLTIFPFLNTISAHLFTPQHAPVSILAFTIVSFLSSSF